jgi:hypothetical protein
LGIVPAKIGQLVLVQLGFARYSPGTASDSKLLPNPDWYYRAQVSSEVQNRKLSVSAHLIWVILPGAEGRYRSIFLRLRPVEDILVLLWVFEWFRHDAAAVVTVHCCAVGYRCETNKLD